MTHPNPEPPASEQAVMRLKKILTEHYDFAGDPSQPIQDLLTDVLHTLDTYRAQSPERDDLDIHDTLERAAWMRDIEVEEPH